MDNVADDVNQWEQKDKFLKKCFSPFGSMNKNDYEIELMHLLLVNSNSEISDHLLSRKLQIPITKVRRLRYEVDLRYPKEDQDYRKEFYNALRKTTYKQIGELIQFSVPNKALREYLSEKLETEGSYFDSSFNSNIIRLTATDLLLIIADFEKDKNKKAGELKKEIRNKIESQSKEFPKGIVKNVQLFVTTVVKDVAGESLSQIVGKALGICIDKVTETITKNNKK